MREFINLINSAYQPSGEALNEGRFLGIAQPTDVAESFEADVEDEIDAEIAESEELVEFAPTDAEAVEDGDVRLSGTLDPRALAKMLPEVDDLNRFVNAVRKVQRGDIATLNRLENRQLAKAFISLLRDDAQMTQKVFQKLRMVHSDEPTGE